MTTEIILNYNENIEKKLTFDAAKVLYGFSFGDIDENSDNYKQKSLHITFKPENMEERIQIFEFADILNNNKINNIQYNIIRDENKINMFNATDLIAFNNISLEFFDGAMNHDSDSVSWNDLESQSTTKIILYFN